MENSNNQSALRQKLDQHNLGYRPGAWENLEQMLNNAPVSTTQKSTLGSASKLIGMGAVAMLILGSIFYLNKKSSMTIPVDAPTTISTEKGVINELKTNAENTKNAENKQVENANVEPGKPATIEMLPRTTEHKNLEASSHHDDNSQPHEGELKIKPLSSAQRLSKSGSDDSGALQAHKKEQDVHHHKKGHTTIDFSNKPPAAHELDNHEPKNKNK